MAYRCGSCGHFAGLDEPEFDASDPEFDGSTVTVEIEATYPSTCCGDTVGTASYSASDNIDFEHAETCVSGKSGDGLMYSLDAREPVATDRFQTVDRHGKPIKNPRYMKHFYGVDVDVVISCDECGAETEVTCTDEGGPPEEYS